MRSRVNPVVNIPRAISARAITKAATTLDANADSAGGALNPMNNAETMRATAKTAHAQAKRARRTVSALDVCDPGAERVDAKRD
jgi:hypothetical protein